MTKLSKIPNRSAIEKKYRAKIPVHEKVLNMLQMMIKDELEQIGLHPTIKARVKTFGSYYSKILRLLSKQVNQKEVIEIYDVIGLRIVCPFLDDLQIVENHVKQK